MRTFLLTSGLAVIAAAAPAPAPQDIDFDLVYALPNPTYSTASDQTAQTVSYTPSLIYAEALPQITATETDEPAATNAPTKRAAACTALPTGFGPVASPDTPANFLALPDFASNALAAPTPAGYTQAFKNLNASNNAYGYLGYTTYKTYDVAGCATKCKSISGCVSFNIYYERDPTVDPGSGDSGCANPPSTTFIKCAFWGGPVTVANANNVGQWRNKFQVVIAGSNGYVSNAIPSIPGYGAVIPLGNAAINAPYDANGFDSYMGVAMFTAGPFNASLCAQACSEKSAYALAHPPTDGSPVQTCQFFNTYILYINSTSNPNNIQGQYCAMYSESWPKSYATNVGQYRGYDKFLIQYSFAYSNATDPGSLNANAAIHQASRDISYSTLQPFCSSYLGYATPSVTATTTVTSVVATTTSTTTTTTYTPTNYNYKREDEPTVTIPPEILDQMRPPGATAAPVQQQQIERRGVLSTPNVLTKYPATILSPACSLQATPVTSTVTVVSTTVTTTYTTATSVSTATATDACTWFKLRIAAPGVPAIDGSFVQQPDSWAYFGGVSNDEYYSPYADFLYTFDAAAGRVITRNGFWFGRWNTGGDFAQTILTRPGGDIYGVPSTCAIDAATHELTCANTVGGATYTAFYATTYGNLKQVYLSTPNNPITSNPYYAPVRLYVKCAI